MFLAGWGTIRTVEHTHWPTSFNRLVGKLQKEMEVCSGGIGLRMLDHDQMYWTAWYFYANGQQQAEQNIIFVCYNGTDFEE